MLFFSLPFVRFNSIRYEIVHQFVLYDPIKSYRPYLYALKKTGGGGGGWGRFQVAPCF